MSDPLFTLGARRTAETVREVLVPLASCAGAWWIAKRLMGDLTATRPLSLFELTLLLSAFVAIFSWYGSRQLFLFNQRRPGRLVVLSGALALGSTFALGKSIQYGFEGHCTEAGGVASTPLALMGGVPALVCQVGRVPDNPYLPGALLRAPWSGHIPVPLWLWLGFVSTSATLGLRDMRLRPTRMGLDLTDLLRLAPASGNASVSGGSAANGVQGCGNSTLWGELCAQLYPADKEFEQGEWCLRCSQVYRRCERELSFNVVSLFTADVDVLNGLERLDALAWDPGEPMPPDARLSGQERWVTLGRIQVPDVITVAQLLALVHEQLKSWGGNATEDEEVAYQLASDRASKLAAWVWMGPMSDRLTYAMPTEKTVLALGPSRLRDLMLDAGEELTLQLEIGLMPVELRSAFYKTFLDAERPPLTQNTKQDIWVPVAPNTKKLEGRWIPRIEGAAMRRWLSLDRMRDGDVRGVSTPLPYVLPSVEVQREVQGGALDLVRAPVDLRTHEPLVAERPGDSLSEWDWMEWQQIEMLRQQALVLVAR